MDKQLVHRLTDYVLVPACLGTILFCMGILGILNWRAEDESVAINVTKIFFWTGVAVIVSSTVAMIIILIALPKKGN